MLSDDTKSEETIVHEVVESVGGEEAPAAPKKKAAKKKSAKKKAVKKTATKKAAKKAAASKAAASPKKRVSHSNPLGVHEGSNRHRILEFFMKHPKKPIPRSEALKGIYGKNDKEASMNFVGNLRALERIMISKGWGSFDITWNEEETVCTYVFTPGS